MRQRRLAFFCAKNMDNYNSQASFGPASNTVLGGGNIVANGMEQPGGVTPIESQVSPASAIYQPGLQVQTPPALPNGSPMAHFASQGVVGPQAQQMPQQAVQAPQQVIASQQPPKAESHVIIEALANRLKDLGKLEHAIHGISNG